MDKVEKFLLGAIVVLLIVLGGFIGHDIGKREYGEYMLRGVKLLNECADEKDELISKLKEKKHAAVISFAVGNKIYVISNCARNEEEARVMIMQFRKEARIFMPQEIARKNIPIFVFGKEWVNREYEIYIGDELMDYGKTIY